MPTKSSRSISYLRGETHRSPFGPICVLAILFSAALAYVAIDGALSGEVWTNSRAAMVGDNPNVVRVESPKLFWLFVSIYGYLSIFCLIAAAHAFLKVISHNR